MVVSSPRSACRGFLRIGTSIAVLVSLLVLPSVSARGQSNPTGSIVGTVTDSVSGQPIAGVPVEGFPDGFAMTDASGHYEITLPEGTYTLNAGNWAGEHESIYARKWWHDTQDYRAADPILIRAGEVVVADFELEVGGRVVGTIVDADTGRPIDGVDVDYSIIGPWGVWGGIGVSPSAGDGSFEISGLGQLDHSVCFSKPGYRSECWEDVYVSPPWLVEWGSISVHYGEVIELRVAITEGTYTGWFWDDQGSEFQRDIDWLKELGVVRGCNPPVDDRFCPYVPVTRAQLAALFHRAFPDLPVGAAAGFTDVDSEFADDIAWLSATGITKGCNPPDNTLFCPDAPLTRGQAAAMFARALGLIDDAADHFVDDDGNVFEQDIDRMATAGITRGCDPPFNDHFCPDALVSRGEMAAFLHRAMR